MAKKMRWRGILNDGSEAPLNSDKARLDWMELHPGKVKNMKYGTMATDVPEYAQPGLRYAIDAAMETMRRELRANGGNPVW